jgi:hypothetical protein
VILFGLRKRRVEHVKRRAFEKIRGYPEEVFEIRVAYAGMEPRYKTTSGNYLLYLLVTF